MAVAYRHEITSRVSQGRLVAILRGLTEDECLVLAPLLVEEGITALEVTMNTPGAVAAIGALRAKLGDAAVIGAGSVLDPAAAVEAVLAGADFLVTPHVRPEVVAAAHRYGRMAIPGAMTPTEIMTAVEAGADLVKVFPAASLGPAYFRDLRGPFGDVPLLATGGVSPANAADFIAAGALGLGVGGSLTRRDLIAAGAWAQVRETARALRAAVDSGR